MTAGNLDIEVFLISVSLILDISGILYQKLDQIL